MVPNNLLIANLVFCNCTKASLSDFKPISYDLVKPLRALRFSPILVLGAGTGCCFFVLGAGIGLYGGMRLFSKNMINCLTHIFRRAGTDILLLGVGKGRLASSRTQTRFWSSSLVIPDNNRLISSLRLVFILLLYIIFFIGTNNRTILHFSLVNTIITHIFTHARHTRVKRHRFKP